MADFSLKLTQGGAKLLAKAKLGKQLNFKYITLGSGVFEGNPQEATSLVNKIIDLTIQEKTRKDTVAFLKATLTYNAVPDGFVWTELGVIAIDPDTQAEVLYMYDAIDMGEVIPPATSATQIEKVIQVASYVSNAPNITAVIDESLINIPKSDIGKPNGVAPLGPNTTLEIEYGGTGANNVQEALYNIGAKPNENLLINPDFSINQHGKNTYSQDNYSNLPCFDGWLLAFNISITKNDSGDIVLTNTSSNGEVSYLVQHVENPIFDENIIFSVIANDKLYSVVTAMSSSDPQTVYYYPPFGRIGIAWNAEKKMQTVNILLNEGQSITLPTSKGSVAKFECSSVQTLARKLEDNTWKSLENPNHTIELAKCQRYLQVLSAQSKWSCIGYADCNGTTNFVANIILATPLRIMPSIKFSGLVVNNIKIMDLQPGQMNYTILKLQGTLESSVPKGLYGIYQDGSVDSFLELSAEL